MRHFRIVLPHGVMRESCREERGGAVFFRIGDHGAEFIDLEFFPFEAYPFLLVDDRARRPDADAYGGIENEGGEENETRNGKGHVEDPFDILLPFGHGAGIDVGQYGSEDIAGPYRAGKDVQRAGDDLDAGHLCCSAFR